MEDPQSFLLEKLKIADRLSAVESQVARLVAHAESEHGTMSRYHETLMKMLEKHDRDINGNGKDGLKSEVDRLNQIEKSRRWHIRMIWAALMGSIFKLFTDYWMKRG